MKKIEFTATSGDVVKNIKNNVTGISHSYALSIIKNKDVKVNEERIANNTKLYGGEQVVVFYNPEKVSKFVPYNTVYEDDNILAVFKFSGIEVQSGSGSGDLVSILKEKYSYIEPAHRIDLNTEGLVIFCKSEDVLKEMEQAFANGQLEKKYTTIVDGDLKQKSALLNAYLIKNKNTGTVQVTRESVRGSLPIKTGYSFIKKMGQFSVLEVTLFTGRTHQIRAHLAAVGLYIVGDGKYGNAKINRLYGINKQCLTASSILFNLTSKKLKYLNDVPLSVQPTWTKHFKNKLI